jgi:hypothetical protein
LTQSCRPQLVVITAIKFIGSERKKERQNEDTENKGRKDNENLTKKERKLEELNKRTQQSPQGRSLNRPITPSHVL